MSPAPIPPPSLVPAPPAPREQAPRRCRDVLREDDDSVVFTVDVTIRTANDLASAERHKLEHYAPITRHSAIITSSRSPSPPVAESVPSPLDSLQKLATIESVTALARPHPPPCAMFVLGSPTASLQGSQMQ